MTRKRQSDAPTLLQNSMNNAALNGRHRQPDQRRNRCNERDNWANTIHGINEQYVDI